MASTHIELTGTETRLAAQYRSFIDQLQRIVQDAARHKAVMDQAAAGGDWLGLRAAYGFSSDADAEVAYNLHTATNTKLSTDADIVQLLGKLG